MKAKDLKANEENPRKISKEKLDLLKKSLEEFGDLSGIVFNVQTKQLVGGHQRLKILPKGSEIIIEKKYKNPTKQGTIESGYIDVEGERYNYRTVSWDEIKEKAANLAANKGAGDWDLPKLSEWLRDIDAYGFDLDLTMFDQLERADLLIPTRNPNFEEGSEEDQGKLDQRKPIECPQCGNLFAIIR